MKNKIKSINGLIKVVNRLKKDKKIVFTNGCFDLLHIGHIRYLKKAKKLGDILIVGINSDNSIRRLKGKKRPIVPQDDRAEILSEFPFVDFVTIFKENNPLNIIKKILPDVLVKGSDWKKNNIIGSDIVRHGGGKIITVPLIKDRSTSNMIKKVGGLWKR
ncbi:MAG: D-glycero-beta-D-manno-heptose 1-phosphate adenylyltransferase [Candidatus Firestonebacteria bacterium]